ncbi:hypothetical protein [Pontibacter ruber]|uniref:Uncharacterized protein n=1 Tax=Pontibacter ruber TaxID=1343895 RepID=A0ABW5CYK2_9BACT|nr:hypothetical protein [Pontibacter ruber]
MRTLNRAVLREMRRQFGYIPNWDPKKQIVLGAVGVFKKRVFSNLNELKNFGINFEIETDTEPGNLDYTSPNGFIITTKVAGAPQLPGSSIPQDKAGVIIDFLRENTIIFRAKDTHTPNIKDIHHVQNEIIRLYKEGRWDKDWVIVTEAAYANRCTLLVATHRNAKAELVASGDFDLANIDTAENVFRNNQHSFRGLIVHTVAQENMCPLFKLMKLKSNKHISPELRSLDVDSMDLVTPATADQFNLYLGEVTFEEMVKEEEELLAPLDLLQRNLQPESRRESLVGNRAENLLQYDFR